jgi:hypothetical protein
MAGATVIHQNIHECLASCPAYFNHVTVRHRMRRLELRAELRGNDHVVAGLYSVIA